MNTLINKTKPLATFAVIADTHLNEKDDECNSPFAVNRLSNRRLRHVVDDLNRRDLASVFHLGDVVHPVPSTGKLYTDSAQCFFEEMKRLKHPLHLIPGNHDVGDKPIDWGPAGSVNDSFLDAWSTVFGRHYFHETIGNLHFLGINAQLLGSGLEMELEQRQWLESTLKQVDGERIFLFTHYPPFLMDVEETEHYDNLGNKGRTWLLNLLKLYRVEALFAGHVHHFWYNRYLDCDCYLLPSTAFVRQDYAEMFHIGPGPEFGRNDAPKLGYILVHVYEDRHDFEMVRCYGIERGKEESYPGDMEKPLAPVNCRTNSQALVGFDLRQDWMEQIQIPPSGALDEFGRKWVRNDYTLLALWEMGVKKLRAPVSDLMNKDRRKRIEDLNHLGFEFTFYSWGLPDATDLAVLHPYSHLISAWEFSYRPSQQEELDTQFLQWLVEKEKTVFYSPWRSKEDILQSGGTYYHVINHGLIASDLKEKNICDEFTFFKRFGVEGLVVRIGLDDDLQAIIENLQYRYQETGSRYSLHLRLSGNNPAEEIDDEVKIGNHIAKAMFLAWHCPDVDITIDTLADNDRGYFPRKGVIDRLYNPKQGFQIVRNLHAKLSQLTPGAFSSTQEFKGLFQCLSTTGNRNVKLILPDAGCTKQMWCRSIEDAFASSKYQTITTVVDGCSHEISNFEKLHLTNIIIQPILLL